MEEKKMKMFEDIKERLTNCENNICFFDDLFLDMKDGSRMRCKCAKISADGELIVTMVSVNESEDDLWKDELDVIMYPNAIFNAITWPHPKRDLLNEIYWKLGSQPSMPYAFPNVFDVKLEDGNTFKCIKAELIDEDNEFNMFLTLYTEYTGEFDLNIDDPITLESLEAISDAIQVPREIEVCVVQNGKAGMDLYKETVMNYTSEEEFLAILRNRFPDFVWESDGDYKYVYHPDKENIGNYVLATCEEA